MDCIFCKIATGMIPSKKIAETERAFAFHDVNPVAPQHALVIPKQHFINITEIEDASLLGELFTLGKNVAKDLGLESDGFRLVVNTGSNGGQSVSHLHLHIIGGRKMEWPPG